MLTRNAQKDREQLQMVTLDDLVPRTHLVRKLEMALDWSFIYDLVEPLYCEDNGRPSIDPVMLVKLAVINFMFGLNSMRRTVREVAVNTAYRWFLGLGLQDPVPHFSTFSKNYTRRFQGTDLFERIFRHILAECMTAGLVDPSVVFVDSTHVKARANSKKYTDEEVEEQAQWYGEALMDEINADREAHGKKPFDDDDNDDDLDGGEVFHNEDENGPEKSENSPETEEVIPKKSTKGKLDPNTSRKKRKHRKVSTVDPESGWFEKGEHKHVFAYSFQTACDKNGVVLGYSVHPGNENDGRTFPELMKELEWLPVKMVVGDTAYKTPAIAKLLKDKDIKLLSTYKRPQTKKGYFKKTDYVYDEYYDCFICPNNEVLKYSTTDREGLREYKSDPEKCKACPYLSQCTQSKNSQKVVTRHVWQEALEEAIENEYTLGVREIYKQRQETIERVFAMAKELHGLRYTQEYGRARQRVKAALTYACMNLKKLARKRWSDRWREHYRSLALLFAGPFSGIYRNHTAPSTWGGVCRQAEADSRSCPLQTVDKPTPISRGGFVV